ncbi:MutS protein [Tolypocladium capitatum]|uniref:DNA mismatch repair protein MSH5 n=1 Tax=Tolypocladium capitatum TaxID=45235 RepID=A0A2K3QP34_9HYPO|nr:MutS protein [Tolypocladium capitatum]
MARGQSSIESSAASASGRRRRRRTPASGRSIANPPRRGHDAAFTPTPTRPLQQDGPSRGFLQQTGGKSSALIDGVPRCQAHGPGGQILPSNDTDCDHEDSDSVLQEVIMALEMRDGASMGCAFFTTATGALALSEDVPMADTNVAEHFVTHIQPTTLLVSARAPEQLMNFLEKLAGSDDQADDCSRRFILRALASSEFSPASALDRLAGLQFDSSPSPSAIFSGGGDGSSASSLAGEGDSSGCQESRNIKLMRLGSLVNLDSLSSVTCAGAVLAELHRRRSTGCLPDGQSAGSVFHVTSVQMFSLANHVFVNTETLQSLQIVHSELHPNSQIWGPHPNAVGAKESLSIYGLFHHLASTPQGRTCLRLLILRPTVDMDIIAERQRVIALLLRPENVGKTTQAASILRKIRNVRTTVSQLRRGIDCPSTGRSFDRGVWATLRRFASQTLKLREVVGTLFGSEAFVTSVHQSALMTVGHMINKTIDFDQSESRRRSSVKAGIDAHLDELKRRYDGMGSFLTEVVNQVNQKLPEWACQYIRSCIFLPQLGFLMVVELDPHTGNGKYEGEGGDGERWEKLFTADGTVCYKNRHMKELDEQYGDMYCEIGGKEVEIIHHLATAVLEHEAALTTASDACGDFDAMLALAIGAEKYNWTAPQMTKAGIIQIENGRHPLQELVVPAFVPNDSDLCGGHETSRHGGLEPAQMLVLTGPNHSGKSIYLKQVAIIVYLSHIGSFVPADRAVVGITDKLLTRISTRESVCRTESAFAIDLKQVAQAMWCSTRQSLVIIDEFGKGTGPDDGAGLLAAVLDHFLSLGAQAPRLLVATHFHELFEAGYLGGHVGLLLGHMDVRMDWEADRVEDQITYLFKLAQGHSSSSFGSRCAALNGVPGVIVDRAEAISLLLSRNEDLSSGCARLSQEEERRLEIAEAVARRFLAADFGGEVSPDEHHDSTLKDFLCDILSTGT